MARPSAGDSGLGAAPSCSAGDAPGRPPDLPRTPFLGRAGRLRPASFARADGAGPPRRGAVRAALLGARSGSGTDPAAQPRAVPAGGPVPAGSAAEGLD